MELQLSSKKTWIVLVNLLRLPAFSNRTSTNMETQSTGESLMNNSSERESHAPAWMRSTKKSNPDKIGICNNLECPLPDRLRVKRSGMVYCAKCNHVNYCNRECQKSDWKRHKEYCFDSSKGEEDKHKKPSYLLFQRSGYNIYLIGDVYSYFRTQK